MDDTSKRGKGRGRGRGRGRGQRKQTVKASRESEPVQPAVPEEPTENEAVKTQPSKVEDKENEVIIPAPPTSNAQIFVFVLNFHSKLQFIKFQLTWNRISRSWKRRHSQHCQAADHQNR